jgi:hypothetical protein
LPEMVARPVANATEEVVTPSTELNAFSTAELQAAQFISSTFNSIFSICS